jgi:hypothetical protein
MPMFLYHDEQPIPPEEWPVERKLAYWAEVDADRKRVAAVVAEGLLAGIEAATADQVTHGDDCDACTRIALAHAVLLHLLPKDFHDALVNLMKLRGYDEAVKELPSGPLPATCILPAHER